MGFFDFFKKTNTKTNTAGEPLDRLVDGELPWGWVAHHRPFVDRIHGEYRYFLDAWVKTRGKTPEEEYPALKSLVLYLDDAGRLCKSMGECFEFWFYNILVTKEYINKRKAELKALTEKLKG